MLDNYDIYEILNQYAKLMDLHNGNPFKIKATAAAAFNIKKIGEPLALKNEEELKSIPSLGKGLASKVYEIIKTGSFEELNDLLQSTPKGVLDILNIKGLGPKKVETIWREMGIESITELLDACRENRLVEVKGFGHKTQEQIIKDIEFKFNQEGKYHWAKLENLSLWIGNELNKNNIEYHQVGAFSRLNETITELQFLVNYREVNALRDVILHENITVNLITDNHIEFLYQSILPIQFIYSEKENWGNNIVKYSSTLEHLNLIKFDDLKSNHTDEKSVYNQLNLPFICKEFREGLNELNHLEQQEHLIKFEDLKGCLHNHSTYSDGLHSLEEMAMAAKQLGLEYFGICDHSQSAFYANGLKPERVIQQMDEIDQLNAKLAPFKVLKGIESDILNDGSLDYTTDVLRLFDFVVASVHSQLKMDEEKANYRLIRAIENPYTTILGHPTGRLILMRQGYPIDHRKIIDACSANGVAIELNAHPYRLDIDWRWIEYAMNKGVKISINPDAHQKEGLSDMRYGVNVARKGYLVKEHCLNAMNLKEFDAYLEKKRIKSLQ